MKKYLVIYHSTKKIECITILWWVLVLLFVHLTSRLASTFRCTLYCAFTSWWNYCINKKKKEKTRNMLALIKLQMVMPKSKHEKVTNQTRIYRNFGSCQGQTRWTHCWPWCTFETTIIKWNRISTQVINARCSNQFKNRVACKNKWGSFAGN
jgi:hypothetical protein